MYRSVNQFNPLWHLYMNLSISVSRALQAIQYVCGTFVGNILEGFDFLFQMSRTRGQYLFSFQMVKQKKKVFFFYFR